MADVNDTELMREYLDDHSEPAFAELVQRHINLVYSVALRCVGNPSDAQDVAQVVFTILVKKMTGLRHRATLTGWLYETTRLIAGQLLRTKSRQQTRDHEAFMQSILQEPESQVLWQEIEPILEEAMSRLNEKERAVLALRFFENKSMAETASLLGLREWAARKRISRAIEKLQKFFFQRGVKSTAESLSQTISKFSIQPAPALLVKTVTAVALAKGATASLSTTTLIQGALKLMAWTNAKTAITATAVVLIIGVTTIGVVAVNHHNATRLETYFTTFDSSYLATAPDMVLIRPTKYINKGNYIIVADPAGVDERTMRRGCDIVDLLQTAYGISREQMILPSNLPRGQFDLLLTLPQNARAELQAKIKKQFGLTAHTESRDMQVLVLKVVSTNAPGLKVSAGGGPNIWTDYGSLKLQGYKMADAAHVIGKAFNSPVVDETGLTDTYDVEAHWDAHLQGAAFQKELKKILLEQFGLELTPDRRPQDMLVVEKSH